jgi:hypothetical protein
MRTIMQSAEMSEIRHAGRVSSRFHWASRGLANTDISPLRFA